MKSLSIALLCGALLGACASRVPPAAPIDTAVPAHWRTVPPGAAPQAPAQFWWQQYGDPVLDRLVTRSLAHNAELGVAAARVAEYRAGMRAAAAVRAPQWSAGASSARNRSAGPDGGGVAGSRVQGEFVVSYEVDLWGRLASLEGAARANWKAERASADAAALAIAAAVASGYLNLRGLDAQLDLLAATLLVRARSRDLARRLFEAGHGARLELLQAQLEYEAASELLPPLKRAIFEQENGLAVLCGDTPGPLARGVALDLLALPPPPDVLPAALLRRRPDVYRAEQHLAAAVATLAATRDASLPAFRLGGSVTAQASTLSALASAPGALWQIGGTLAAVLADGGRKQALTDADAARRDQAIHAYTHTVRAAFAETDNALGALARLGEQALANDARLATAQETLRIAQQRNRHGYTAYLDVLDAQRIVYAAQAGRLQLRTRQLAASVDLVRVLGGGWDRPAQAPATGTGADAAPIQHDYTLMNP